MYRLKLCHKCYMKNMAQKRVGERQIHHGAKAKCYIPSQDHSFECHVFPYCMSLGSTLDCIAEFPVGCIPPYYRTATTSVRTHECVMQTKCKA